jgi:HPt (histidine-containing phosphotransfer) domain-containing protein
VVEEIKETIKSGDMETAARLAHTVKGVAGNLGAEDLFPVAGALEKAIKQEEMDGLDGLIDNFETELNIVMGGIQELEDRDAAAKQDETPAGEVTIDIEAVKPLLVEMAELLESDLMEAMNRLEALEQHLKNSKVREEFSQLSKSIEGFDTDSAIKNLKEIAETLSISIRGYE